MKWGDENRRKKNDDGGRNDKSPEEERAWSAVILTEGGLASLVAEGDGWLLQAGYHL